MKYSVTGTVFQNKCNRSSRYEFSVLLINSDTVRPQRIHSKFINPSQKKIPNAAAIFNRKQKKNKKNRILILSLYSIFCLPHLLWHGNFFSCAIFTWNGALSLFLISSLRSLNAASSPIFMLINRRISYTRRACFCNKRHFSLLFCLLFSNDRASLEN